MIPEVAVEAAARQLAEHDGFGFDAEFYRADATAALEAAAPHMLAQAWDEAFEAGRDRGEWEAAPVRDEPTYTNPHRSDK